MSEKIKGSFYTATIDKSEVVASDGTILDFRIDISCGNGELFKELIEHIELFHEIKNGGAEYRYHINYDGDVE